MFTGYVCRNVSVIRILVVLIYNILTPINIPEINNLFFLLLIVPAVESNATWGNDFHYEKYSKNIKN